MAFDFVKIPFISDLSINKCSLYNNIYRRQLDIMSWQVFSKLGAYYSYNSHFFEIDEIFDSIVLSFYDLFLINSVKLLYYINNIYYYYLYSFSNDIIFKIYNLININKYLYKGDSFLTNRSLNYYIYSKIMISKKYDNFYKIMNKNLHLYKENLSPRFYNDYGYYEWEVLLNDFPN